MGKTILLSIAVLFFFIGTGQRNFKWEKVDSVAKTKEQLYSDTKMFIAENWKSSQSVIQNDDKEVGVILVRGEIIQTTLIQITLLKWIYSYSIKFFMRDGKYKMIIENVTCTSAYWGATPYSGCIVPCDDCPIPKFGETGLNKTQYSKVIETLRNDLQSIVDRYATYIQKPSVLGSDW